MEGGTQWWEHMEVRTMRRKRPPATFRAPTRHPEEEEVPSGLL